MFILHVGRFIHNKKFNYPTYSRISNMASKSSAAQQVASSLIRREFVTPPREFKRGQDIHDFIERIEIYSTAINSSNLDKIYIILNNLNEDVKLELCALPDYVQCRDDFDWICDKLKTLHADDSEKRNPLLSLLKLKQNSLSLRQFMTELRIKAFRLMGEKFDSMKREKHIITSFINGLNDSNLRILLSNSNPKTLDEAYELIKNEREEITLDNVHYMTQKTSELETLKKEIRYLKDQVTYLTNLMKSQRTPQNVWAEAHTNVKSKCFNCNKNAGHVAKFCKEPCGVCGLKNHTSYNCKKRNGKKSNIRFIEENEENASTISNVSCMSYPDERNVESEVVAVVSESTAKSLKTSNVRTRKPKTYADAVKKCGLIEEWAHYIDGTRTKPKQKLYNDNQQTIITQGYSETARNKPLIRCKCESLDTKIFLDSGAECNAISLKLLKKLEVTNGISYPIKKTQTKIKCANGSLSQPLGTVWLDVKLGQTMARHPFRIIPGLFPDFIGGIKFLKEREVVISSHNNGVFVKGQFIRFISNVQKEERESNWGNGRASNSRTGMRCKLFKVQM